MNEVTCLGLPGAWVNAWLAAVGATVLDPRLRLHWTTEDAPVAVLSSPDLDPLQVLAESWPSDEDLGNLPIAADWHQAGRVERKVPVEAFQRRAKAARSDPRSWALSSTMTDLSIDRSGEVAHAPFDPPAPRGSRLHHRVLRVHKQVGQASATRLHASLLGRASRVKDNGLGFDQSRLGSLADDTDAWVEPVVELLAFFGLAILPMRGKGADRRTRGNPDERQRGWRSPPHKNEERRFVWPAWQQPLDAAGIDALLDIWNPWRPPTWRQVGVHAGWRSVRYSPRATADATRAIGAERL